MIRRVVKAREFALAVVLAVMFAAFALSVPGFLDAYSLLQQSRYWVITGMIAVPMTFIIITAGIDLSVGSMVALCGIVLGILFRDAQWPIWAACLGAMAAGTLAGGFNGAVSSYVGVPPLVVTLATMALYRGLAMGLSQAATIGGFPPGFTWLSQGGLFTIPGWAGGPARFPVSLVPLAVIVVGGWLLLRRTWIGRFTECIGENETAAQFAAIDTRLLKCALYTACGLVCGIAAVFQTALFASAKADTATGLELEVIACVVVGGTRISGGQGSILGSVLGLLIIGVLRYGLMMAGAPSHFVIITVGALVIFTAVFNEWMARPAA